MVYLNRNFIVSTQHNLETAMITRFTLIVLLFVALNAQAEIYKCVSPTGKIEFVDKPCEKDSEEELILNKEESDAMDYANYLNSLVFDQITEKNLQDNPEIRKMLESVVKAASLKLYTRKISFSYIEELCFKIDPKIGREVAAANRDYFSEIKPDLAVGRKVFDEGLNMPEQNYSVTNAELVEKVNSGKAKLDKQYRVNRANSKEEVVQECKEFVKLVVAARRMAM